MNFFRKRFEHLLFARYMTISMDPKTKAEFIARDGDGYADDAVQQAWTGFQIAMKIVPGIFKDAIIELEEQRTKHGYSAQRDRDQNLPGSLTQGAASYLISACGDDDKAREIWPFPHHDLKPGHCRHSVVKAAALLAADDVRTYADAGLVNSEGYYAVATGSEGDEFTYEGEVLRLIGLDDRDRIYYHFTNSEGREVELHHSDLSRMRPVRKETRDE